MKTFAFVFFAGVFLFLGNETSSQDTRVNLALHDASIGQVLNSIENQTSYYFLANQKLIDFNRKIDVQVEDASVSDILVQIFSGTNVKHIVSDKMIILSTQGLAADEGNASVVMQQQEQTVSGSVTDAEGMLLPGVTVYIKDTFRGTTTDANGFYSIPNVPSQAVLVFSFMGMETREVPVGGRATIDVVMAYDLVTLEEVVFIGYGTVKKADFTGAVSSVQGDRIAEKNTPMISQALQGAIPGLMVTRSNNKPGSGATIRVRGITTIGDSNPLILVDGIPVNDINDINPNDIEDITVLKDAASASIYGARAAAGVILVTTKRPQAGVLSLDYSYNVGFEQPTRLPQFADAVGYMNMVNELRWNDIGNVPGMHAPQYTMYEIDNYAALHAENPDLYPKTDWMGLLLKERAMRSSHSLNISAGTEALRTRFSVTFDDVDGLYMGNNYKRISTRFNNDIKITSFLDASVDFHYKRETSVDPSVTQGQVLHSAMTSAPVYAAVWSNGFVAAGKDGNNMYAQILNGGFVNSWDNVLGGKVSLDLTPIDDLTISAVIAPEFKFFKRKSFLKRVEYTNWDDPTTSVGVTDWGRSTRADETRIDFNNVTTQFVANYAKTFGKHSFNTMAGYESYYFFREIVNANSDNLVLDSYPYLDLANTNFMFASGSAYENAYESFFGRVIYSYDRKYLFQANVRVDGSSRFHRDYRWGTFPSFSAGWVVSEESFMENINPISFLKLRGSYGVLGNERIGNYPYQATINFATSVFYRGNNIVADQTAAQWAYAIPDISWETTEILNVGFDAHFLRDRLDVTFDIYNKNTRDMLLALEIPDFMGYDNPEQNTGEMYTKGWEVNVGWRDNIGQLRYAVSANLSDFRSIMGDLGGIQFIGDKVKLEGSEFDEWYGYRTAGIFQNQDQVSNAPVLFSGVSPGDIWLLDVNGPDGEPDGRISPDYDRVLLGGSLPRYLYGANINLGYKGIDFSLTIQGVGKQNAVWTNNMRQPYQSAWRNMPMTIDGKYWSVYNTDEENLAAQFPRFTHNNTNNNYAMSDFWMFSGAYLRLKNIVLGYTIPKRLANSLSMKSLRVHVSVSDIFSIDKYPDGWDPEVANTGYPITTSFIFGASVKF